jgi:hypothetical protein
MRQGRAEHPLMNQQTIDPEYTAIEYKLAHPKGM